MRGEVIFSRNFSKAAKSFIQQLLVRDPARRLGGRGAEEIKKHAFFKVSNFLLFNCSWYSCQVKFLTLETAQDPVFRVLVLVLVLIVVWRWCK